MIYIFDVFFILIYLYIKYNIFRLLTCKIRWYLSIKEVMFQFEWALILIYMYIRPQHTLSEGAVSFWICLTTIILFNVVILRKFRYKKPNCKI